jgi:hypothetical protein
MFASAPTLADDFRYPRLAIDNLPGLHETALADQNIPHEYQPGQLFVQNRFELASQSFLTPLVFVGSGFWWTMAAVAIEPLDNSSLSGRADNLAWEGLRACDTDKQDLLARRRLTGRTDRDKEKKKKLRRIE